MSRVIGLWLIFLGMTMFFTFTDPVMDFKEKLEITIYVMVVITVMILGAYLLTGG